MHSYATEILRFFSLCVNLRLVNSIHSSSTPPQVFSWLRPCQFNSALATKDGTNGRKTEAVDFEYNRIYFPKLTELYFACIKFKTAE